MLHHRLLWMIEKLNWRHGRLLLLHIIGNRTSSSPYRCMKSGILSSKRWREKKIIMVEA